MLRETAGRFSRSAKNFPPATGGAKTEERRIEETGSRKRSRRTKKKKRQRKKTVTNSPAKRSVTESRTDVLMEHVKATNNNGPFPLKEIARARLTGIVC